ncbi:unnamed protein product [Penicillium salamii]|nr:unnamed protein product [Penicillium salamii]
MPRAPAVDYNHLEIFIAICKPNSIGWIHWIVLLVHPNAMRCTWIHCTGRPGDRKFSVDENKRFDSWGIEYHKYIGTVTTCKYDSILREAGKIPLQSCQLWACYLLYRLERKRYIKEGTFDHYMYDYTHRMNENYGPGDDVPFRMRRDFNFLLFLFTQKFKMTFIQAADAIITDRGGVVENRHWVHAAIVDSTGKLLFSVGDPTRMTLARSAAKPIQTLAILETPGFDNFNFEDADLALMCASHSSEEQHIARARSMLVKANATEADMRCGPHPPLSESVNRAWIKGDYTPSAICSNCSGKHAGMLAGAKALGAGIEDYHLPSHPIQSQVRRVFEELCSPDEKNVPWGLDGCNLPAPATSLRLLGKLYATVAASVDHTSEDYHGQNAATQLRTHSLSRIFNAMGQFPELVAGEGRFCTELMRAFPGQLIGKLGADGCYGIGIRESEQTRNLGANGALGIAVKIEDGDVSMLYAAVTEILRRLQIGTPKSHQALENFHSPKICNTVGVVTGHVSHSFRLHPAL